MNESNVGEYLDTEVVVDQKITCREYCLVSHQLKQIFGLSKESVKGINNNFFDGNMKDFYKENREEVKRDLQNYKEPMSRTKETKSDNDKQEAFKDQNWPKYVK